MTPPNRGQCRHCGQSIYAWRKAVTYCTSACYAAASRRTHCRKGHPFDEANTRIWKDGRRTCIECDVDRRKACWDTRRKSLSQRSCRECGERFQPATWRLVYCSTSCQETRQGRVQREKNGRRKLLSRFQISPEHLDQMVLRCEGRCEACGDSSRNLNLDHCHSSGAVRGMLCTSCNLLVGALESPSLDAAATYLARNGKGEKRSRETMQERVRRSLLSELKVPREGREVVASVMLETGAGAKTIFTAKSNLGITSFYRGKIAWWSLSAAGDRSSDPPCRTPCDGGDTGTAP